MIDRRVVTRVDSESHSSTLTSGITLSKEWKQGIKLQRNLYRKHSLASPAINTTSPHRINIAIGWSCLVSSLPSQKKDSFASQTVREVSIVRLSKSFTPSLFFKRNREKGGKNYDMMYLMLTIGLLLSASLHQDDPPKYHLRRKEICKYHSKYNFWSFTRKRITIFDPIKKRRIGECKIQIIMLMYRRVTAIIATTKRWIR